MRCGNSVVFAYITLTIGLNLTGCGTSSNESPAATPPPDVPTFHNDNMRSGQNLNERVLTHRNVNVNAFGKIAFLPMDGKVDAQPLFLANVNISGQGAHAAVYVASEHGTLSAFDADTAQPLWSTSLLGPGEYPSDPRSCLIAPEIGITSTPVIDRKQGPNGAIYAVAMSLDSAGQYHQRLHALDITSGAELFGGPTEISATYPGSGDYSSNGVVAFDPKQYKERAALLLLNGVVYTTWSSHCDIRPYTGWILGYDAATLKQKYVLNVTPNGNDGAIWMSGGGPAADGAGNIYILDGNGTFDEVLDARGFPSQNDFGNAFLKLSVASGSLTVTDYLQSLNEQTENAKDLDLGSGGALLLPDLQDSQGQTWHLAVGAGKDGNIYLVNRDSMGGYSSTSQMALQVLEQVVPGGIFSTPAFFNNTVYLAAVNDYMKAFSVANGQLSPVPTSQSLVGFGYPGATPSISANGTKDAILWAVNNGYAATLHAYDATDLSKELYNSEQAPNERDQLGPGNKFIVPTIVNGKVYVGTTFGVMVYGLR
jgi:outer membrane protein assembly factor BamB